MISLEEKKSPVLVKVNRAMLNLKLLNNWEWLCGRIKTYGGKSDKISIPVRIFLIDRSHLLYKFVLGLS